MSIEGGACETLRLGDQGKENKKVEDKQPPKKEEAKPDDKKGKNPISTKNADPNQADKKDNNKGETDESPDSSSKNVPKASDLDWNKFKKYQWSDISNPLVSEIYKLLEALVEADSKYKEFMADQQKYIDKKKQLEDEMGKLKGSLDGIDQKIDSQKGLE